MIPLARFETFAPVQKQPAEFSNLQDTAGVVEATIKLKAPGLRGKASGIVRLASGGQYLVELYGRGQLFLKVYFTPTQTILWPAAGMPVIYGLEETPTLDFAVHSRLPKWRLDDVLPVPYIRSDELEILWVADAHDSTRYMQRIVRDDCIPLIKGYDKRSGNPQFPYQKVVLATESGSAKLVWSLRQANPQ